MLSTVWKFLIGLILCVLAVPVSGVAADRSVPADFDHQVAPFFRKYCLGCHAGDDETKGGLGLQSFTALMEGGDSGKVIVPGKSSDSRLVKMMLGTAKPKMPPKDALQPKAEEIELVRRWVDLGAHGPDQKVVAPPSPKTPEVPHIAPKRPVAAPATSVAFSANGQWLAVALNKEVWLIDSNTGDLRQKLAGATHPINAVAVSADNRLVAAAEGTPGIGGRVFVWTLGVAEPRILSGHTDSVYSVAFSPDNRRLVTASYDKLLLLWDVETAKLIATLKHHTGPVFAASFSSDGRFIASASADQTAKIWNAATGERLATMSEPRKSLTAVAFQPGGREVAAAGADKMVRIWSWDGSAVQFRRLKFAHDAGVLALAYSADGKTLYSAGEDRFVRGWDAATLEERFVSEKLPDWPLGLAVSPDGSKLAVSLYSGSVLGFDTQTKGRFKDYLSGGRVRDPAPRLDDIEPQTAVRGTKVNVFLKGRDLAAVDRVFTDPPGLKVSLLPPHPTDSRQRQVEIELPADLPPQSVKVRAHTSAGDAGTRSIYVGPFPETREMGDNDSRATAKVTALPATWLGTLERRGDRDYWAFDAKAGQELVFQGIAGIFGKRLQASLRLTLQNAAGQELASAQRVNYRPDVVLGFKVPQDGRYYLEVTDRDFTGGAQHLYIVHAGEFAYVTEVFPLGVSIGPLSTDAALTLKGFNVPAHPRITFQGTGPQKARVYTQQGLAFNKVQYVASPFPELVEKEPNDTPSQAALLPVPGAISGRVSRPMVPGGSSADFIAFEARKGQRLVVEVFARRYGSPLDSVVDILQADGQPLVQNTLRAVSETYTVLRDHDSSVEGIRLNNWEDFRINDYLLSGNEVMKLVRIPPLPDEDLRFYSNGQRLGFFGTTPEAHAINQPVYKVEVHPPGAKFSANGMPVVQLPWRNDDGGPGFRGDSRLLFDVPVDGKYFVRVRDVRDQSGEDFVYRLVVRPQQEDFKLSLTPENPNVPRGSARTCDVNVERLDGFEGPIDVVLQGLPPGVTATPLQIEAGTFRGQVLLSASEDAPPTTGTDGLQLKVIGRSNIDGKVVERTTLPAFGQHQVSVAPAPEFLLKVEPPVAKIAPGKLVKFRVTLERRSGFADRVPVQILNLPTSMFVVDLGLNGVLINENTTTQTFVVGCYPFVRPGKYPFYASGKQEKKDLTFAAPPIVLEVDNPNGLAKAGH